MSDNLETDIRFVSSRTQFENVESLFGQWFVISNEFRSWFEVSIAGKSPESLNFLKRSDSPFPTFFVVNFLYSEQQQQQKKREY